MGISPFLPVQSTGLRGRAEARLFRVKWRLIAAVSTPLLVFILLAVMKVIPDPEAPSVIQEQLK